MIVIASTLALVVGIGIGLLISLTLHENGDDA